MKGQETYITDYWTTVNAAVFFIMHHCLDGSMLSFLRSLLWALQLEVTSGGSFRSGLCVW